MYRDIKDLKEGYQPRNKIVRNEKNELITDIHSILARSKMKHFFQLFNIHAVNEVR